MGQVNTVNARAQFSEIINRAAFGKERVTLTRLQATDGVPIVWPTLGLNWLSLGSCTASPGSAPAGAGRSRR